MKNICDISQISPQSMLGSLRILKLKFRLFWRTIFEYKAFRIKVVIFFVYFSAYKSSYVEGIFQFHRMEMYTYLMNFVKFTKACRQERNNKNN